MRNQFTISLLFTFFLLQSCTLFRFAYMPSIQNVPALQKKNDSRLTAVIGNPMLGNETSYSIQSAYAVSDHFAITGALNGTANNSDELSTTNQNGVVTTTTIKYRRPNFEIGAGWIQALSKDKKVIIETYVGYSKGKNKISDFKNFSLSRFHNSSTNRFYIQPIISFHPADFITLSGSLRYNTIDYTNIQTDYSTTELQTYRLQQLGTKRFSFLEPCFMISAGIKSAPWIRFQAQSSASYLLGNENLNFYYRESYFSFGIMIDPVKILSNN